MRYVIRGEKRGGEGRGTKKGITLTEKQEIKKAGGLGWKGKMVVAWATGREIADGLLIRDLEGREFQLTAMALREELFNRLIAIGNQIWEAW